MGKIWTPLPFCENFERSNPFIKRGWTVSEGGKYYYKWVDRWHEDFDEELKFKKMSFKKTHTEYWSSEKWTRFTRMQWTRSLASLVCSCTACGSNVLHLPLLKVFVVLKKIYHPTGFTIAHLHYKEILP